MSFGFGVGDIFAAVQLVKKVRQDWVDAPQEYGSIRNEIKNISNILQDVEEISIKLDLDDQRKLKLEGVLKNCCIVLKQCEDTIEKFSTLEGKATNPSNRVRRAWRRFKLDPQDIRHLREQLVSQMMQLNALHDALQSELLADFHEDTNDLEQSDAQRLRTEIANWYASQNYAKQYSDQLAERRTGTGTWFLTHPTYLAWRNGTNTTVLCPGIPGSGKTIMTAAVIDDLLNHYKNDKSVIVIYFHFVYKQHDEQTCTKVLQTLIRQLFQEKPQVPTPVHDLYLKHRDRGTYASIDELKSLLCALLLLYSKVFIIMDALDECAAANGHRYDFINDLFHLQEQRICAVNILATTRFLPDITDQFSSWPQLEVRAHKEDIERYLDQVMHQAASCVRKDIRLQNQIKLRITERAEGMFLLVKLQFDSLCSKTTITKVEKALQDLQSGPDALGDEYDKALRRINDQTTDYRDLAHKVLAWITYARRQLLVNELREALAMEPGVQDINHEKDLEDEAHLISVCAGLVTIDKESRIVRLIHYTTQEYLIQVRSQQLVYGQNFVTRSCLYGLKMKVFDTERRRWRCNLHKIVDKYKFLDYAGKNWGFHALEATGPDIENEIQSLLGNSGHVCFASQLLFAERTPLHAVYTCERTDISALHLCAFFSLVRHLAYMIEKVSEVDREDSFGETPLLWAVKYNRSEIVRLLIENPNLRVNLKDEDGQTPLLKAAEDGHFQIVNLLVQRPGIMVNSADRLNQTPLLRAADCGYLEIVKVLLQQPDITINVEDAWGQTPLSRAAKNGHLEIVKLLLQQPGIIADSKDADDWTPLSEAARNGHLEIVKLLLQQPKVEIDSRDKHSHTPLSKAAGNGHFEIVQLLILRKPAKHVNLKYENDRTLLAKLAENGFSKLVELILCPPDIEINQKDSNSRTLLSWAAKHGHIKILKLLLRRPDVATNCADKDGWAPLSLAAMYGHFGAVRLLLQRPDVNVNCEDKDGWTPLSLAASKGYIKTMKLLLRRSDIDVNSRNSDNSTPLLLAAEHGYSETVKLLLRQAGIEADAKNDHDRTPLLRAAELGHVEIVKLLLQQPDVDVNATDMDHWTPLSFAAGDGDVEIVKLLLRHPAIVLDPRDKFLKTPLSYATFRGNFEIVTLLWEAMYLADLERLQSQSGVYSPSLYYLT